MELRRPCVTRTRESVSVRRATRAVAVRLVLSATTSTLSAKVCVNCDFSDQSSTHPLTNVVAMVSHYVYVVCMCAACECDEHGAEGEDCDAFGQCQCRSNFGGSTCDRCASGFYRFPNCLRKWLHITLSYNATTNYLF